MVEGMLWRVVGGLVYRLYWLDNGRNVEREFASLTEAWIQRAVLRRRGIVGRVIAIRTVIV